MVNTKKVETYFCNRIHKQYEYALEQLNEEYQMRYDLRQHYGFDSDANVEALADEWLHDSESLAKRRDYLWALAKSHQFKILDGIFGTRLARRRRPFQERNNGYILFSKIINRIPDVNVDFSAEEQEIVLDMPNDKALWRRRNRNTVGEDTTRIYQETVTPRSADEWWRLGEIALALRTVIENLESLRARCSIPKLFKRSKSIDGFENIALEDLQYQGNVKQDPSGDSDVVQVSQAHNVLLTDTEVTQTERAAPKQTNWTSLVSNDTSSSMDNLVNRWFRIGSYDWSTQHQRNQTLLTLALPRDAVLINSNLCNQPNCIPFGIHRYWRGDMVIKIQVNCNKFQIGQLQVCWYYHPKADASFPSKANIYTRSGAHHTIITAAPNNEVEMIIPFKSYKAMLHTKKNTEDSKEYPLDLGSIFVTVLSPLKVTGETSPKCNFTVFVKFINSNFTGMIAGNVDRPAFRDDENHLDYQMDLAGMALPLVEKLLVGSSNDNNRDNPPVNAPPNYVVPSSSHSWSIGTNLAEPLNNLRLSGTAQTKHPDPNENEMSIDYIKRKFMINDIFQWSQQRNSGDILFQLPVNPIPPKDRLTAVTAAGSNMLKSYQLTPIGFLSSLHQYWRGSIEFRFDIVASQFHSGKLLMAYIPGIAEGATVTLAQARASPHVVVTLDNAMSYTWTVPYVADVPWWPRRYAGESKTNNTSSPSKLFVFVLNELVLAESVPDSLDIIVYMRGGQDMEFAIPVQPSVGLGYDRAYIASRNTNNVYPVSPTDTFYVGTFHEVAQCMVLRRAATSNAYAAFTEPILDRPVFYNLTSNFPRANCGVPGVLLPIAFCIFVKSPSSFGGYIALPVYHVVTSQASINRLETIAMKAKENNYEAGAWITPLLRDHTAPTTSYTAYGFLSPTYVTTSNTYGGGKSIPFVANTVDEVAYQGNRDVSFVDISTSSALATTGAGSTMYGESFVDLKDLTRRYQMYGQATVPAANVERDPGSCSLLIPLVPGGLELNLNTDSTVNQVWNRAREGHIPLISSLYRFFRGSMRLRIVISNGDGLIAWVQHKPDRRLGKLAIVSCNTVSTAEAVFNHTYGVFMQDLSVNRVIELELPYYQKASFGLLQQPVAESTNEWADYYSLGELAIGFFGSKPTTDLRVVIYYSLADDCRFSTYQGVPPLVLLDDLPEYQGFFSNLFGAKQVGSDVAEGLAENLVPSLQSLVTEFSDKINSTLTAVGSTVQDFNIPEKLAAIASQFLHAIANPTATTIAISVTSVLITIGVITLASCVAARQFVIDIWAWIVSKVSPKKQRDGDKDPVDEVAEECSEKLSYDNETHSDGAITGFLTLLCGGMCTLFGIRSDVAKEYKSVSDVLFKNIDKGMKMSNTCFVFLRNILSVLDDMRAWCMNKIYPGFNVANNLLEGREIIEKWTTRSMEILDPHVSCNIKYNRELQCRLLDCYSFGKILKAKALSTHYPGIIQHIGGIYDKLHKISVELINSGIDPQVRKLPFTIYNFGVPGIGKSHLTNDLCTELCKSEGIGTETTLACILNSTSKFWDNCDRQPCLVMDDAFNIRKGVMLEDQIASIFNVVSPVVLIPPKAAVEDKGRAYNPEIFVINSNVSHYNTEICDDEALWRRRDILIYTTLHPNPAKEGCLPCKNKTKHITPTMTAAEIANLKDFHHLQFQYTFDVTNTNALRLPSNDTYITYRELLSILKDVFKKNRISEHIKFSNRVAQVNSVLSKVPNCCDDMDNLEQLWNDAIAIRKANSEKIAASTWKCILNSFYQKVRDDLSEVSYTVKRKIAVTFKPGNNKYDLKNPLCKECIRIKYQCIKCADAIQTLIAEQDNQPSASASPYEYEDDIFAAVDAFMARNEPLESQMDTAPDGEQAEEFTQSFIDTIDVECDDSVVKWLRNLSDTYPRHSVEAFYKFIELNFSYIMARLRKYPRYVRTIQLFKDQCIFVCDNKSGHKCVHNPNINAPIYADSKFCFINYTSQTVVPDPISNIGDGRCTDHCYMLLPWIVRKTAVLCRKLGKPDESWMEGYVSSAFNYDTSYFDIMFTGLTEFCAKFYYNCVQPVVRGVIAFFTTFKGFCEGMMIIAITASVVSTGVMAYAETRAQDSNIQRLRQDYRRETSRLLQCADDDNGDWQSKQYADVGRGKIVKTTKAKIHPKYSDSASYQACQQFDVVEKRLDKNLVNISAVESCTNSNGHNPLYTSSCLLLKDRELLIQRHYYDFWKNLPIDTKFFISHGVLDHEKYPFGMPINIFSCNIEWFGEVDPLDSRHIESNFGIMHLPLSLPPAKDITKFIAKSSDHQYIKSDEVYLYHCVEKRAKHCYFSFGGSRNMQDADRWLVIDNTYSYQYSGRGLCGSVLLSRNLERPIIGIHFAGNTTRGFSEPLAQETFTGMLDRPEDFRFESLDLNMEFGEPRIEFDTLIYPKGTTPAQYAQHQGSTTQWIPSMIHGVLPVDSEPGPLHQNDARLPPNSPPLKLGIEHMGKPPKDFPKDLLDQAEENLGDIIMKSVKPLRANVDLLSYQDAICGIPSLPGYESLNWSSSEGYPLSSLRPKDKKGKKWLFKLEEVDSGYILKGFHGALSAQLGTCYNLRKKGIRCPTIFSDCLKDSCIASDKCRIPGKTRVFSISPIEYTIACKRYFGDFLAAYQEARLEAEHGIGINRESVEWTLLANKLTSKSPYIVAADYKNFGPGAMLEVAKRCCNVIMRWYTRYDPDSERQLIRRVLLSELLNAEHLSLNVFFNIVCGIPSGSPFTAPLNSMINCIYLRCGWLSLTSTPLSIMNEHCVIVVYGDDVCMNVSSEYIDVFNTETLSKFFRTYDIVFTDIDKSDNIVKFRSLDNVSFLKCGFKLHPTLPGVFLAPIEEQSIRKCVNWINRKGDSVENTIANCLQACELAFGLGPNKYNQYKEQLQVACIEKLGKGFSCPTWREKSERCFP